MSKEDWPRFDATFILGVDQIDLAARKTTGSTVLLP